MTNEKIDWDKFKPIPGFDCVRFKREIQAEIYEETKNMTTEEVREYFRRGSEEFQRGIAALRKQQAEEP